MLSPMGRGTAGLLRDLRQATLSQLETLFVKVIDPSQLQQNASKAHSRARIFTLNRTFWCWIWQALHPGSPCSEVVDQLQALTALLGDKAIDESSSAYCQARLELPVARLAKLFATSAQCAERAVVANHSKPLLAGRPIHVIDGSGARLPDTASNRSAYPPSKNMAEGAGFPFMRISALFSLASGALLDYATGSLHISELRLFTQLLPKLQPKDILMGDRAYGQYVIVALLLSAGVEFIGRVPSRTRKVDFRKVKKRLGFNDGLFAWTKPVRPSAVVDRAQWDALPVEIEVRMLRYKEERRGFRTKHFVIVTTLTDAVASPASEISAAYARRWRMEMCFDDLKTTLGMESLRCKSPGMLQKELLIFLIAHNLIRWLIASAAFEQQVDLERISFKGALGAFRQWSQAMAQEKAKYRRAELWGRLLRSLVEELVPHRPGRNEPRAVKRRTKYPPLNRKRCEYVQRWSRNKRRRAATAKRRANP